MGAEYVEVSAVGVTTAGEVLARVRRLPGGAAIGESTLVAVNLKQASPDSRVVPGDEIAVLPPLAGG